MYKYNATSGFLDIDSKQKTSDLDDRYVNVTGDTMTGALTLSGDPTANLQAATKQYVDNSTPTVIHKTGISIDGGGDEITTGEHGFIYLPFSGTIKSVTLIADTTGSIKIDIWKDTYANYPPTDADSICGGNEPEISSGVKYQDTTLTGWTTTVSDGDVLKFNVDSCATITKCTLVLEIEA